MSIIYPLVQQGGPEFQLPDGNFAELERVGEIALSAELRRRLDDIGHSWTTRLRELQSPRSKQFRKRLKLIEDTLEQAYRALDLNREGSSIWEYHLFNWARNTGVEGAVGFFEDTNDEWPYWPPNTLPSSGLKPTRPFDLPWNRSAPRSAHNNTGSGSVGSARAADPSCAAGRILIARAACHARTGREYCRIFTAV
jgi:hypothetical protein